MAGASRRLAADVAQWRYEDLPPEVVATIKRFIFDTIGVIGGAAQAPGIAELNARIARWEPTGTATGLIGKRRYSPPSAALANGAAAHALDFDDQHDPARVHTNCVVLPTLLATAEEIGRVSGQRFHRSHRRSAPSCMRGSGSRATTASAKAGIRRWCSARSPPALAAGRLLGLDAERHAQRARHGVPPDQRLGAEHARRRAVEAPGCRLRRARGGARRVPRGGRPHRHAQHARRQRGTLRALRARRSRARIFSTACGRLAHPRVQLQAVSVLPLQPHGDRPRHRWPPAGSRRRRYRGHRNGHGRTSTG